MENLIYLFIGSITPFLILMMANIVIHFKHYSTYSRVYKLLPTYTFKDVGNNMVITNQYPNCLLYTSPSPRDRQKSRMPSSA